MKYLGHIIIGEGIEMDLAKVQFIRDWPEHTSVPKVNSFIGFLGYYCRFMKDF